MSWNKNSRTDLSPEEYVTWLYHFLLKREPDNEGLVDHVSALRRHGDHTKVFKSFLESPELRNGESRKFALDAAGAFDSGKSVNATAGALDTRLIIDSSLEHFADLKFLEAIKNRSDLGARRKRKIETIAVYYPKMSNGGTERVTSRQIIAWKELGYRVILLSDLPADPQKDYFYGDVERLVIPPKMMGNQDYQGRGHALSAILTAQKVDLFINNLWDETSTVWDVLIAKSLGIPVVIGWHNIFDTRIRTPDDLHLANVRLAGYRYADLVTTLSTVDKLWFRDRGITARVVYNPLTFETLPAQTAPLSGRTVVWVARAERHQKRLDLAIRMFSLVLQKVPNATLLIVGGGPDLEWAKEYAHSLGIANQISFTGYSTDVAPHFARSDVHILTSEFEGWCLAIGEAWAYGVPTVMFDLPYLEYVQSGKGFISVGMRDISAMADQVSRLLLDDTLRKRLGREAREVIEDFDKVVVKEEWRKIFTDMETLDDLDTPLEPTHELRGLRALTTVLADRFLNLANDRSDYFLPVLPSQRPTHQQKKMHRRLLKAGRAVTSPFVLASRSIRQMAGGDRQLRMIDLSHVGLGDNIMIWTGLFAMLSNNVPVCAPGCVMHVPSMLVDIASRLFAPFGILIQRGKPARQVSPIYTPLPPTGLKEWWHTYIGRDWRMNWVEALDEQKAFPRNGSDKSFQARVRLNLSERILYRRHSWAEAMPGYIGYRVWLPLARKHGVYPLMFLSQLKRSLQSMRVVMSDYVDEITAPDARKMYERNAAFPTGKSFQTISPSAYSYVNSQLGGDFFTCYVQRDSAWFVDYENHGIRTNNISDIQETLKIIKYSRNLLTTDSFTSHIAQLLRDDFVLVLSRDLKESVVHPGSNPTIMANHPACAPCNYQERQDFDRCVAGYKHCIAFENDAFIRNIADCFCN